jgi:hypothetical protein
VAYVAEGREDIYLPGRDHHCRDLDGEGEEEEEADQVDDVG